VLEQIELGCFSIVICDNTAALPCYPGCILDEELTWRCGILDMSDKGDTIMVYREFDIEEDLILKGVRLNIPPFLRGKQQLNQLELVETRQIASLRIHVERAMECLKNFHIFDKPLPPSFRDTANQVFYICTVLTNFILHCILKITSHIIVSMVIQKK